MQQPTCTGIRIRTPLDAQVIFHGVNINVLPMVTRRLDTEERRAISSGCVYVWEERGPNAEATGLGIERWTDGIRWGPSRVRDEFLFYQEKEPEQPDIEMASDSDNSYTSRPRHTSRRGKMRDKLIKQTYSVFVDTPRGRRKWHLIAYFTQDTVDYLQSIEDIPELACLQIPRARYESARSGKRPRDQHAADPSGMYDMNTPFAQFIHGPDAVLNSPTQSYLPTTISVHTMSLYNSAKVLAPLAYLRNIPPPRRHPLDEKALMSFTPQLD